MLKGRQQGIFEGYGRKGDRKGGYMRERERERERAGREIRREA